MLRLPSLRWVTSSAAGACLCDWALQRFKLEPPVRFLSLRMSASSCGVSTRSIAADCRSGLSGAGIALAMQSALSDVAAGMIPSFIRSSHMAITFPSTMKAAKIWMSGCSIRCRGIPIAPDHHSKPIVAEILHNYGKTPQFSLLTRVACGADLRLAFSLIENVLRANPRILVAHRLVSLALIIWPIPAL